MAGGGEVERSVAAVGSCSLLEDAETELIGDRLGDTGREPGDDADAGRWNDEISSSISDSKRLSDRPSVHRTTMSSCSTAIE